VRSDRHVEPVTQSPQHLQHRRQLLLGEQVHLQIQMCALVRLALHAVLRHQHGRAQEDGLQRDDQHQQAEWIRVRRLRARHVEHDPPGEPDGVRDKEERASRGGGHRAGEAIEPRLIVERFAFERSNRFDVTCRRFGNRGRLIGQRRTRPASSPDCGACRRPPRDGGRH